MALAAWIGGIAATVASQWILSSANQLQYSWISGLLIWMTVLFVIVRDITRCDKAARDDVASALRFPPFLILGAIIFVVSIIYLPVTHDSLSYRIPRMYLWLQEGHVGYVSTSDQRINYMTPNWELASLPVLLLMGTRFLTSLSFVSWILLYLVGREWAKAAGFKGKTILWVALFPALSAFSVLQARSTMNDLFVATLLFGCAWFAFSFSRSPDSRKLVLSGLALCIACGTKPHFLVLSLPWGLWFLFARPSPWRHFPWKQLYWLLPVILFTSPFLSFLINWAETGSYKGAIELEDFVGGNPFYNILFGGISFIWQSLQPPINPFAGMINSKLGDPLIIGFAQEMVPRFSFRIGYLQIVDGASAGLVFLVLCLIGWGFSLRMKGLTAVRWVAVTGIAGFILAASQVVPGSIGRSFMGFLFLLVPLAIFGLRRLPDRWLGALMGLLLFSASLTLIFDASRPFLPPVSGLLTSPFIDEKYRPFLKSFTGFRQRATAGSDLFERIPDGSQIVIISGAGDPLVEAWNKTRPKAVYLAPAHASLDWVKSMKPDAIVVTGTGPEMHSDLIKKIALNYHLVGSEDYLVRLRHGYQKWELYAKPTPPN